MRQLTMYRPPMPAPPVEPPAGWHIRSYKPGDGEAWCRCCQGGALGVEEAPSEALFCRLMLSDPHILPENVFFIVDSEGQVGGTTTLYCPDEPEMGTIHMVAVGAHARGKGLSTPVCAAAIARGMALGRERITLTTDDFRIAAIRSYLKLGFLPVVDGWEMRRRWQALLMPLGRASLPCVDGAYRPAGELMPLFTPTLSCWAEWSRYYQDREAFAPVVEAIHAIEGWERPERLEALTPGTNFVVKCGDRVVKIYAPAAVGADPGAEQAREAARIESALAAGLPTPAVLARGVVHAAYDFYYLVMPFAKGTEAGAWIKTAAPEARLGFARRLTGMLCAMHGPQARADLEPLRQQALENPRFACYGEGFRRQAAQRLKAMPLAGAVEVHGDLTGENVLIDGDKIILLDFADGCQAPVWYEWPPLFADLLGGDGALIRLFVAGMPRETAACTLADALLLHDFGPDILAKLILPQMGRKALPEDLDALERICYDYLEGAYAEDDSGI